MQHLKLKILTMKRMGFFFLALLCCCLLLIVGFKHLSETPLTTTTNAIPATSKTKIETIGDIPLPEGFTRVTLISNSFAAWLRTIKIRKDNTVYLYNGKPLADQSIHYSVLDISTGNKDLQQCADAIMRLKAEYYFSKKEYDSIWFQSNLVMYDFKWLSHSCEQCSSHDTLLKFLDTVFMYCGTYTIDEMTKSISMQDIQPGHVLVKAGAPGHAMIVVDVAENKETGKKIYLLAQGYMPAQDMHIVINPNSSTLNPWYEVDNDEKIITPGWVFTKDQLKRWK